MAPTSTDIVPSIRGRVTRVILWGACGVLILGGIGLVGMMALQPEPRAQGKPLSYWASQAREASPESRRWAADALGTIGLADKAAIPALIELLGDKDHDVRSQALYAMRHMRPMGSVAKEAVPVLTELLRAGDLDARSDAALVLETIGPVAKTSIPALTELRRDNDSRVRSHAAYALGTIGPTDKTAISALIELLGDKDSTVRGSAANSLGNSRSLSDDVIPALTRLLRDGNSSVQVQAARALVRIGPETDTAVVPVLIGILERRQRSNEYVESSVQQVAVEVLGWISLDAKAAIPILVNGLRADDESVRIAASNALQRMGPEGRAALSKSRGDQGFVGLFRGLAEVINALTLGSWIGIGGCLVALIVTCTWPQSWPKLWFCGFLGFVSLCYSADFLTNWLAQRAPLDRQSTISTIMLSSFVLLWCAWGLSVIFAVTGGARLWLVSPAWPRKGYGPKTEIRSALLAAGARHADRSTALWIAWVVSVVGSSLMAVYASGAIKVWDGKVIAILWALISPSAPITAGLILASLIVAHSWPPGWTKRWLCCFLGFELAQVVAWQAFGNVSLAFAGRMQGPSGDWASARNVAFQATQLAAYAFDWCALGLLIVFAVSYGARLRLRDGLPASESDEKIMPCNRGLFPSCHGRVGRATVWGTWVAMTIGSVLVRLVAAVVASGSNTVAIVIQVAWLVPCVLIVLTILVRRWHDLGLSGWMVLTSFIPYPGLVLSILMLGFVKGTDGPNIYGNDPLFSPQPESASITKS